MFLRSGNGCDKFFRFDTGASVLYPELVSGHVRHLPENLNQLQRINQLMKKSFVLGVVLSLSTLCFAGQKSFTIILDKVTNVGTIKLTPGEYKVKVDGANAVFTNSNYKSVSTAVKVETADKKFKETAVDTVKS